MIDVTIVGITKNWTIVQYVDDQGYVQRRYIPKELLPVTVKGPATLSRRLLLLGMDYSNVDLTVALGEQLPSIAVRDLQDALRHEGLWTAQDYKSNPGAIEGVIKRMLGRLCVNVVVNAAYGTQVQIVSKEDQ